MTAPSTSDRGRFTALAAAAADPGDPHGDDLQLAHRMADLADEISLQHRDWPRVRWKWDGSPVTEADLAIDTAFHQLLQAERPDDGVLTEERPERPGRNRRRWVIDPLDGTSLYAYGEDGWGTLIALEEDGELVLGLAHFPADDRRYWSTSGCGAHRAIFHRDALDLAQVRTSDVSELSRARATAWQRDDLPAVRRLRSATRWQRPDQYFLMRLLDGDLEVLYSTGGAIWDHAAGVALVTEAGGRFQDHQGGRRYDRRGGLYTNGPLLDPVVALLAGPDRRTD